MNIEILSEDKHDIEVSITSITVAEVLREYLNQSGASFVAWRREHPSKPVLMKIKSDDKTVSKVVGEAIASIKKDCDKLLSAVKK